MLLRRGADPNGMLNRMPCTVEGALCGPEALALRDVFNDRHHGYRPHWLGVDGDTTETLKALLEGHVSADSAISAGIVYEDAASRDPNFKHGHELCDEAYKRAAASEAARIRQQTENVVAILGIVSFWRRVAAAPGSKAATRAVERCTTSSGQP